MSRSAAAIMIAVGVGTGIVLLVVASGARRGLAGQFVTTRGAVLQRAQADCGLAAIATLALHGGIDLPPYPELLTRFASMVDEDGLTVEELKTIASNLGIRATARRIEPVELRTVRLPVIVHLTWSHYVVLLDRTGARWMVADPAIGVLAVRPTRIIAAASGVIVWGSAESTVGRPGSEK